MSDTSAVPLLSAKRSFEFNLEALRGFAALIVVIHHSILHVYSLDPSYTLYGPLGKSWMNPLPGHSSVLLFFVLSGYVIGLTNKKPLTKHSIISYLKKRFIRLYPIYVISLLFTLLIAANHYSVSTIVGHLLFLQNAAVPYIFENNPLWSLNNEILYYILFIPISCFRLNIKVVTAVSVGIGILAGTVAKSPLLSSYCFGFVFWLSGLLIAQADGFTKKYSSIWLLSAWLVMFLGYETLNPLNLISLLMETKLGWFFYKHEGGSILFADLFQLPFCLYVFLVFINRSFKYSLLASLGLIISTVAYYIYLINRYGPLAPTIIPFHMPMVFFAIGTLLFIIASLRAELRYQYVMPNIFLKLGAISYGLYVIHFPVSICISRITFFSGSMLTFFTRLVIEISLTSLIGYILELKIQPIFKQKLSI
jgi:peptidoglycan/LPS O-acetylase OafA/YrhL